MTLKLCPWLIQTSQQPRRRCVTSTQQESDWIRFHKVRMTHSISHGQSPDQGPTQLTQLWQTESRPSHILAELVLEELKFMNGTEKTTTDKQTHNRLLLVSGEMQDCLHEFISLLSWQRALSFHIICSHLSQLLVTLRQHRPRPRWKATNEYISCASTGIMLTHAPISWYLFTRTHLETSGNIGHTKTPTLFEAKAASFLQMILDWWAVTAQVPTDLLHHSNNR